MKMHVHIFGASGSGTTTLGREVAAKTKFAFFDADDFYWEKTDPPFTRPRRREERQSLLRASLGGCGSWIISGSMMEWGDFLIPDIDLAVYKYVHTEIRIERLIQRDKERYGNRIEPGNDLYEHHREFIEWAKSYDTGGMEMRSKKSHEEGMKKLPCRFVRLEEILSIEYELDIVLKEIMGGER
jgi:adenylate kinase family enzyme